MYVCMHIYVYVSPGLHSSWVPSKKVKVHVRHLGRQELHIKLTLKEMKHFQEGKQQSKRQWARKHDFWMKVKKRRGLLSPSIPFPFLLRLRTRGCIVKAGKGSVLRGLAVERRAMAAWMVVRSPSAARALLSPSVSAKFISCSTCIKSKKMAKKKRGSELEQKAKV